MGSWLNRRDAVFPLFPFALAKRKARVLWIGGTLLGDFFHSHCTENFGRRPAILDAHLSMHAPRQLSAPLRRGHARERVAGEVAQGPLSPLRPRLGSSASWESWLAPLR